jgi:hypothetical protein
MNMAALAEKLGPSGTVATSDDIIDIVKKNDWSLMTYGAWPNENTEMTGYYAEFWNASPTQKRFPNGYYLWVTVKI